jgi:siroheme synthase
VRLKGGDPFVFGRGGEEALACAEAGVPVTHRDFTKGVVLVTGHARGDGELDLPWASLARCGLTLVFFMGVSTIERIARELVAHDLDPTTPVLVVQEGTLPTERHVRWA